MIWWSKSHWTEFPWASLLAWTCDIILSLSAGSSVLYHSALPDKSFSFFQDSVTYTILVFFCFCAQSSKLNHSALLCFWALSSDLYQIALLDKIFFFLQNQVIYTNPLIWTKAFLFLWDPVIYNIQLSEIKAFLFLRDPVTLSTILLYFFFHGRFHLCIAFFSPFCM